MAKGMFRAAAAAGLLVGFVGAAQAGITWFNNRATWAAAAGAASFSEDFSGFAADTSFRAAPVALSGMSIAQEGANVTSFRNLIDALPHVFGDNNGTTHASMFTDFGATTVRLAFDASNGAFGADSWGAANGEIAQLSVFDGVTLLGTASMTDGAGDFIGYVLDGGSTATSVLFASLNNNIGTVGEGFGLDNLAGVNAVAGVPEPASLALVGLAAAGLAATRRRRAR